ncbi:peptidoglycan glycosyltransferase [Lutibacter sp. Hel_I_33_5]|uniref:penicillin-binding protein 2 n=1 Tax=Lutibacter sp. Hel_I_33_5 TaxID=1566289 RepID=UPI00119EF76D|nr:penicillin-binding protein 2 [Lutibacter sp. Hel_I_33_5]TVZ56741.1 peptidoglycan glycosyltransferase [Lutibacter sp. Hel_I_33_5]
MSRSFLLYFLITLIGIIFIGRLFQLQILRGDNQNPVQSAAVKIEYDLPERGYIYDRNGILLVANQVSYDVMVVPKEVEPLDTVEFCSLLKIDKNAFIKNFNRAHKYAPWLASPFLKQLDKNDFAYLQEKLHKFKGFFIQKRIIRNYPINSAANVVGYISEVSENIAKKSDYYQAGELLGKAGIERQYEKFLRGIKGKKHFKRNRLNKITGIYKEGKYDTLAVNGQDLTLTIDSKLQQYAELLMKGKRGGIVALEPSSGEILALVTAPSYDPNMMVGRQRSKNSVLLFNDTINKPMYDRGLEEYYSPGSPFKMINALIGLQEGVINPQTPFYCYSGYRYGSRKNEFMGCHCGIYGRPIRLKTAISKSCNSYFSNTYKKIVEKGENATSGLNNWSKHVKSFGLGNYLGYDLPAGKKGLIPDGKYYNDRLKYRWNANSNISNAIGQGEIITTPIQLANVTAAIANRGFFYTPHIVKKINSKLSIDSVYLTKKKTTINSTHFSPIIDAMHEVFKTGTGKWSQVPGIEICGKTGTVENFIRINGEKTQLEDHSILVAFAPKENPKIALAVFVENGGYGSTIGAPVTSLLIEKYLNGKISNAHKYRESNMINLSLKDIYDQQLIKPTDLEAGKK